MAVTKCRSRTWDMLFRGTEKESEKLGAGAALSLDSSVLWVSFIKLFLIANEASLKKLECLSLACFLQPSLIFAVGTQGRLDKSGK